MRIRNTRRLRVEHKSDDFSPMEGVGNMADAMLVFACGLLLALLMSMDVDVSDKGQIESLATKYEVDGIEENASSKSIDGETPLEEMGKVYRDPKTGKYYVVENQPGSSAEGTSNADGSTTAEDTASAGTTGGGATNEEAASPAN